MNDKGYVSSNGWTIDGTEAGDEADKVKAIKTWQDAITADQSEHPVKLQSYWTLSTV